VDLMADWILVPCLDELRAEFNELGPGRDHASDGSIGNAAHAASESDHNPDETGATGPEDADSRNEVHAIDVDDSGPWLGGFTFDDGVELIRQRCADGRETRLQYIIRNGRICSRSWGWAWRPYTGSNGHYEHAHFSARYDTGALENDTRPWGLLDRWELPMDQAAFNKLMDGWAKTPAGAAALNGLTLTDKIGDKAYPTRAVGDVLRDLAKLRGVLVGDPADSKNAALPANSPLGQLLATPADIREVKALLGQISGQTA
jgi:hypothetical protein